MSATVKQSRHKKRPAWQLQKLRATLITEKDQSLHDGRDQTWPGICESIAEATGVLIPHERLRQFVEGVRKTPGAPLSYPVPQPDRIEAVVKWAVDTRDPPPRIPIEELEQEAYVIRAPHCLNEMMAPVGQRLVPAPKIVGSFTGSRALNGKLDVFSLSFEKFTAPDFWHVNERHERYAEDEWHLARLEERPAVANSVHEARGWALLSPEDQLLVFMKEPIQGLNHRWMLVAFADFWSDVPLNRLSLLRQESPYDGPVDPAALAGQVKADIVAFERVSDGQKA